MVLPASSRRSSRRAAWVETCLRAYPQPPTGCRRSSRRAAWVETYLIDNVIKWLAVAALLGGRRGLKHRHDDNGGEGQKSPLFSEGGVG